MKIDFGLGGLESTIDKDILDLNKCNYHLTYHFMVFFFSLQSNGMSRL